MKVDTRESQATLDPEPRERISRLEGRISDLEGALIAAQADLQSEKLRSTAWLSTVSHDLRGPLSLLLGYSQQAARRLNLGLDLHRVGQDLEAIENATRRLTLILDQIGDSARLEQGSLNLYLQPVEVVDAIRHEVTRIRRRFPAHTVRTYLPSRIPTVWGDKRRIRQVIASILANAAIFSGPGQVIRIGARDGPSGVTVSVIDRGVGLSQDELPHVFDRAFRPDRLATIRREGLGVSLWVARSAIAEMGGSLSVESPGPGRGATFLVRLPKSGDIASSDDCEASKR